MSHQKGFGPHLMLDLNQYQSQYNMIMVGHLMQRNIDAKFPASLSKKHIQKLTSYINYNGLIITDDLNMAALKHVSRDKSKLATLAASAGNHLLLFEYLTINEINQISQAIDRSALSSPTLTQHIIHSIKKIETALNDS